MEVVDDLHPDPATAPPPAPDVLAAGSPLRLPIVEERFTRQRHPVWPQVQEAVRSWVVQQRLLDSDTAAIYADALRYTDLVAEYYLEAPLRC